MRSCTGGGKDVHISERNNELSWYTQENGYRLTRKIKRKQRWENWYVLHSYNNKKKTDFEKVGKGVSSSCTGALGTGTRGASGPTPQVWLLSSRPTIPRELVAFFLQGETYSKLEGGGQTISGHEHQPLSRTFQALVNGPNNGCRRLCDQPQTVSPTPD